jgi:hypothetical protein
VVAISALEAACSSERAAWSWVAPAISEREARMRPMAASVRSASPLAPSALAAFSETTVTTNPRSEPMAEASSEILRAAVLLSSASFRTSSATTAKPRPASPARAASMAAFRASRFV